MFPKPNPYKTYDGRSETGEHGYKCKAKQPFACRITQHMVKQDKTLSAFLLALTSDPPERLMPAICKTKATVE